MNAQVKHVEKGGKPQIEHAINSMKIHSFPQETHIDLKDKSIEKVLSLGTYTLVLRSGVNKFTVYDAKGAFVSLNLPSLQDSTQNKEVTSNKNLVFSSHAGTSASLDIIVTTKEDGEVLTPDRWKHVAIRNAEDYAAKKPLLPKDVQRHIEEQVFLEGKRPVNEGGFTLSFAHPASITLEHVKTRKKYDVPSVGQSYCLDSENRNRFAILTSSQTIDFFDSSKGDDPGRWHVADMSISLPYAADKFTIDENSGCIVTESRGRKQFFDPVSNKLLVDDLGESYKTDPHGGYLFFVKGGRLQVLEIETQQYIDTQARFGITINNVRGEIDIMPKGHVLFGNAEKGVSVIMTNLAKVYTPRAIERVQRKKARLQGLMQGIGTIDTSVKTDGVGEDEETMDGLEAYQQAFLVQLKPKIDAATSSAEIKAIREALPSMTEVLENNLRGAAVPEGKIKRAIRTIIGPTEEYLLEKGNTIRISEIYTDTANAVVQIQVIYNKIDLDNHEIGELAKVSGKISRDLKNLLQLPESKRDSKKDAEVKDWESKLKTKTGEFLRKYEAEIRRKMEALHSRVRSDLAGMNSTEELYEWQSSIYPQISAEINSIDDQCPELCENAKNLIQSERKRIHSLVEDKSAHFEEEGLKSRSKIEQELQAEVRRIRGDMKKFFDMLRTVTFSDRDTAEADITSREWYGKIVVDIEKVKEKDPQEGKELDLEFKIYKASFLYNVSRPNQVLDRPDGGKDIVFGDIRFPYNEIGRQEKFQKKIEIGFKRDEKVVPVSGNAKDYVGHVYFSIRDTHGRLRTVNLETLFNEDHNFDYNLGYEYRGNNVNSFSFTKAGDYQKRIRHVNQLFPQWLDENSPLRKKLQNCIEERRKAYENYKQAKQSGDDTEKTNTAEAYKKALKNLSDFYVSNSIPLLRKMEEIYNTPDKNGDKELKDLVPRIDPRWIIAPEDDKELNIMAENLKMQMERREGMLLLSGHAGTGKDVLLRIFSAKTNRPFYRFDGTKWTTETDLGEDILLQDGSTVTIPSAIIRGIQTPNAVVYFNEFNAMPEIAQVFLHGLFDGSRSMTLKTSGQEIRAAKGVLMVGSMNPPEFYPGTFDIQPATKSRTVTQEIKYSTFAANDTGEALPTNDSGIKRYEVSEAMKLARNVDSLVDLTIDPDFDRNEFIQVWNKEINGEGSDVSLTPIQKFDLKAIFSLIYFANKLRENFFNYRTAKGQDKRNALPVDMPITLRELTRCAYILSNMPESEKQTANPDDKAKELLERFFVSHETHDGTKKEILQGSSRAAGMKTWTSPPIPLAA